DSTHEASRLIVDDTAERHAALAVAFGGSDEGLQRVGRIVHCLLHAQREEYVVARVDVQRLAPETPHQFAQQYEINIAIDETSARQPCRLIDIGKMDAGCVAAPGRIESQVRT